MFLTRISQGKILVLAGGAILAAPAVPASTGISARLKRVLEHSSPVHFSITFNSQYWGVNRVRAT